MNETELAGHLIAQGMSDNTVRSYTALWNRWTDWAHTHHTDPHLLAPADVRAWANTIGSRAVLAQAAGMVKHARAAQGLPPQQAIRVPTARRTLCRALTEEDTRRLAQHASTSGTRGLAVLVGLFTAARRSEIASLRWDRIDFLDATVTLDRPKNNDLHTVPLHPTLAGRLQARRSGEHWVFPGRWGGHVSPTTIGTWVAEVGEAVGLRITSHQLRHTALASINDATGDLRATQQMAGHLSPVTTVRYTRVDGQRLAGAVDHLNWLGAA